MTQLWNSIDTLQNESEWFPFRYDNCSMQNFEIKKAGDDLQITIKNVPYKGEFTYVVYRPGSQRSDESPQGVARVSENGEAVIHLPNLNEYTDSLRFFSKSFIYRIVSQGYVSQVYRKNLDQVTFNTVYHNF